MGASDLLGRLALAGVRLSTLGRDRLAAEPRAALTDELRALIRANKSALLEALSPVERGREVRHRAALAKLAGEPDKKRVAIFDDSSDPVICTIAIRDLATFEMQIPRSQYDPFLILEVVSRSAEQ